MKWIMLKLIDTLPSKLVGTYRITLGIIYIVTGSLKFFNNRFSAIWSTQLKEIEIPFYSLFFYGVPVYEILLGGFLVAGYYSRICAMLIIPLMIGAIYTYMTVYNSNAFFFHPYETFYPSLVIMFALIVLLYGGGRWSIDLRMQRNHSDDMDSKFL